MADQYPESAISPNLKFSLDAMPVNIAQNFLIIDGFPLIVPIIQAKLQSANVSTPQSVSAVATQDSMFTVSIIIECNGGGLITDTIIGTLTWTDQSQPPDLNVITFSLPGNVQAIQTEIYPISVKGGTSVNFATSFGGAPVSYEVNVRLVEMP